jgi:hypothetical protein
MQQDPARGEQVIEPIGHILDIKCGQIPTE